MKVGKLDLKEEAKSSKEKDEVFDVTFILDIRIPSLYFFISVPFLLSSSFSFRYFVFSSISLFLMKKGQAESPKR